MRSTAARQQLQQRPVGGMLLQRQHQSVVTVTVFIQARAVVEGGGCLQSDGLRWRRPTVMRQNRRQTRETKVRANPQAVAAARHIAAIAGESVRDAKRVRLSDFNRGAGVTSRKDHAHFGDHTLC